MSRRTFRRMSRRVLALSMLTGSLAGLAALLPAGASAQATCMFPNAQYQHVIYVQFDNLHLRRDNPNVPSDLEQIPALKGFLTSRGSLLSNDHTVLISHTAGGITSTLTGLYPDRMGINVSNSYQYFTGDPNSTNYASAFKYWTDPVGYGDPLPNMITNGQKNTPAPWVAFTRAGCDVGAVASANIELENTSTGPGGDITSVYDGGTPGVVSPQAAIAANDYPEASADFEGIAIHCAAADSTGDGLCSAAHNGVPDNLPNEPGGYAGYNGLFGALYVNSVIAHPGTYTPPTVDANSPTYNGKQVPSQATTVNDVYDYHASAGLHNPPTQPITDGNGHPGFMGFDPTPAQALGYVARMQEAGVPVTMAYIADAHDCHSCSSDHAFGPGEAGYVQQLRTYNQAFRAFFDRLAQDGIDQSNTLFVFTVDEGDHYAGGPPINSGCDGVTVPCRYSTAATGPHSVGEQDVDLVNALERETGNRTAFDIHADDAPTFYVHGSSLRSGPGPNAPYVRQLERDVAKLTLTNQRTGAVDTVTQHIADRVDEGILHMINTDPSRTPTFTLFGNPDYYFEQEGPFGYTCPHPATDPPGCPVVDPGFAWNHGDDNPEIGNTWVGFVGPTIQNLGQTSNVWTDHTDVRPTMLEVLGLAPDYKPDGRVIAQVIDPQALPSGIAADEALYAELTGAYKQLDAPFGAFSALSEVVSTKAVRTNSPGDEQYRLWDAQLSACRTARDSVVAKIRSLLYAVEFSGRALNPSTAATLTHQSKQLVSEMQQLAVDNPAPHGLMCQAT